MIPEATPNPKTISTLKTCSKIARIATGAPLLPVAAAISLPRMIRERWGRRQAFPDADILQLLGHGTPASSVESARFYGLDVNGVPIEHLSGTDIRRSSLHHNLVLALACESGVAPAGHADQQHALATAILAAGARACVGTLWPVHVPGLESFTRWFYPELPGVRRPVEAFTDALVDLATPHEPATWFPRRPFWPESWEDVALVGEETWAAFAYFGT